MKFRPEKFPKWERHPIKKTERHHENSRALYSPMKLLILFRLKERSSDITKARSAKNVLPFAQFVRHIHAQHYNAKVILLSATEAPPF